MANRDNKKDIWQGDMGNMSEQELLKNAKNADVQSLMQKLSPEQREKVQSILNDPEKTRQILSNPKIQGLIRKLRNNE